LAATYPDKLDALMDFARALDLSDEALGQLRELIEREKAKAPPK
jgi:hypothetical protein